MTEQHIKKQIHDYEMYLDKQDEGLSKDLIQNNTREPHTTKAYRQQLTKQHPNLVVDIGAHIGYYALQPPTINPDTEVLAIEPHQGNIELLQKKT